LFTGIYGTAWVAGSIVIGLLTGASVGGLVAFRMACEPGRDPADVDDPNTQRAPARQPAGGTARFRQLGSNPVRHANNWSRPILQLV
jgi:hypothetical protein